MTPGIGRSRGRAHAPRLLLLHLGLAGCASAAPATPPAGPEEAAVIAEPVAAEFTAEQATRGQRVFTTVCAVCHGRNEFTGPIFALTWMAEPVGHLFQHISTAMPQDRPGSLSAEEYAAIVAYMLQLNGRTAGDRELPADAELLGRTRW
jgi:mono/diheme cytochrome c family protein